MQLFCASISMAFVISMNQIENGMQEEFRQCNLQIEKPTLAIVVMLAEYEY